MNTINEKEVFEGGRYLPPDIKIVEIKVEKGFAKYGDTESEGPGPGDDPENPF